MMFQETALTTARSARATAQERSFRSRLSQPGTFVRVVELVTTRGLLTEPNAARVVSFATDLAEAGVADALSITDNAGGHPKFAPEALGTMLLEQGQQVIIHLTCKDLNRNGLESRAWTLANAGFENVLCLTGDHPVDGYMGQPGAVFDLDSVGLLHMLHEMNQGLRVVKPRRGEPDRLPPTNLFLGATVSPFKRYERELIPQYLKLQSKISNGAQFIITQVGYDSRKLDELQRYLSRRLRGDGGWGIGDEENQTPSPIPHPPSPALLANVCVLTPFLARHFNKGAIPGVVVSDELLALAETHAASADKGKAFFQEFAAKQIAIARGLGYGGAYLTGNLDIDDVQAIFARADSFAPDDWRDFAREIQFAQPEEFYLLQQDPETGLSSGSVNQEYLDSLSPENRAVARRRVSASYRFSRLTHEHVFEPASRGFSLGRWFYSKLEKHPLARRWLHASEQTAKIGMFDCRDCGDCSLPDIAYLCPESQCSKNQRNGPCGGSRQGTCELGDKECIWARAYERLKPYGEERSVLDRPPVYTEGNLRGSSAWSNSFLERDHHAKRGHGDGETRGRGAAAMPRNGEGGSERRRE